MATVLKVLGQSTFGLTVGPVDLLTAYSTSFAVPTGKAVLVKNVRFANKDASATRTLTVTYLPAGANAKTISPKLSLPPGYCLILDDEFVLVATDKLQVTCGEINTVNNIDFMVNGIERDQA